MSVTILKIAFHNEELEGRDVRVFDGFETIKGFEREAALRFMFEMYDTHNCCGLRVDTEKKIALGCQSENFIYEIVD